MSEQSTRVPKVPIRGLRVTGRVSETTVKCLIDTGCTETLLAISVYNSIPEERRPLLSPPITSLKQANGSALKNLGSAWMDVSFGSDDKQRIRVTVADIEEEALLGMNYLSSMGGSINFATGEMKVAGETIKCETAYITSCARVSVPSHLHELYGRATENVAPIHHEKIGALLREYGDVFSEGDHDIGRTSLMKHKIVTGGNIPIKQSPKHPH